MKLLVRFSALLLAPALFAQDAPPAPAKKKFPSQPAAWVDPIKSEPAGTRYQTFTSKLAASSALPNSEVSYLPPAQLPGRSNQAVSSGLLAAWFGRQSTGWLDFPAADAARRRSR